MTARHRPGDKAGLEVKALIDAAMRETRHQRIQLGMSLRVAARRAGMSPFQLSRLELGRIRHPTLDQLCRAAREVGPPVPGDRRAWDGRFSDGDPTASIEAVTRLDDIQEVCRIELKRRDDPAAGLVIVVIGRTAHHRRVMAAHHEARREAFPLGGAAILRELRRGRVPATSGILMV